MKYSAGVDTYFIGQIFEQLVKPDPTQKRVNWLAESWDITEVGGKPVLDVKLRKGVKFHNGDPLTARDFEFSQKRLADPAQSRWLHTGDIAMLDEEGYCTSSAGARRCSRSGA